MSLHIARYCTTPELSLPGYGCLDHFLEQDTVEHSWEVLSELLLDRQLDGILYDVGMPVRHNGNLYNARIVILDGKILLIRPKMSLAMAGKRFESMSYVCS
jgi:NAD+ synthase (glutamine-hydrolysing)